MLAVDGGQPVRRAPWPAAVPEMGAEEEAAVVEVVRSRQLNRYAGNQVKGFEAAFAALHGVQPPAVVACTSGTAAVHLAVGTVDPAPGDEIIVAPISDFGTVIPILAQNAVPVFADVRPDTYCLDPEDVARKITARTRAIVCVHLFGQPCELDALRQLAAARGIALVEDCCQAPLAEYRGRPVGTWGDFGCFSLQQSKHITTGDGGMTIARDPEAAGRMRLFMDKGWPREGNVRTHIQFGMNYRMNELAGAVARVQVGRLAGIVARRQALAARLDAALAGVPGMQVPALPEGSRSAYWMYHFNVAGGAAAFARAVRAEGVPMASGYVMPLYLTPVMREKRLYGDSGFPLADRPAYAPGLCPNAEAMAERMCYFVMHQGLGEAEIDDMAAAVRKVAGALAAASA